MRSGGQGIVLGGGCVNNAVRDCRIEGELGERSSLVCVAISSVLDDPYAGYFRDPAGRIKVPRETTYGNVLERNWISGGTHGVAISGSSRNRVVNNTITSNTHRNINICPAASYNLVLGNTLLEAGSSAVAMAYGSSRNTVSHNIILSYPRALPEAARRVVIPAWVHIEP
jgi:parallel beta-helix repeat protein